MTMWQANTRDVFGTPVLVDVYVEWGRFVSAGGAIIVGTGLPTEIEARARYTVRSGLADVLAWLGEPVLDTPALDAAVWHYGLARRSAHLDHRAMLRHQPEWIAWFRRHGIDPRSVPVPSWVYVDDERRVIRRDGWVRDELDRLMLDTDRGVVARTTIDHHLGDPIAPFPGRTS